MQVTPSRRRKMAPCWLASNQMEGDKEMCLTSHLQPSMGLRNGDHPDLYIYSVYWREIRYIKISVWIYGAHGRLTSRCAKPNTNTRVRSTPYGVARPCLGRSTASDISAGWGIMENMTKSECSSYPGQRAGADSTPVVNLAKRAAYTKPRRPSDPHCGGG